jgi:hypothetical protein
MLDKKGQEEGEGISPILITILFVVFVLVIIGVLIYLRGAILK